MEPRIESVALVEPTVDSECLTTEVFWQIRSSLPFLAGALKRAGFRCRVFCEEIVDLGSRLDRIADDHQVVGISITINTVSRAVQIARALKARRADRLIVFGGVVAGHFVDELLSAGDFVVLGRGEIVLPRLLEALNAGADPGSVRGIAFRDPASPASRASRPIRVGSFPVRVTEAEEGWADLPSEFSAIEGYGGFSERRNVLGLPKPPLYSFFFSTGCVYRCRFCMSDRSYRARAVENVVADLREILSRHRTLLPPRLMLVDDCPFGDLARFRELLKAMAEVRRERRFSVMMQFHVKPLSQHPDLPGLLHDAGVTTLLIGFETVSDASLASQNKGTTLKDNVRAIEICRQAGLVPYGYFVVGFETDTADTVRSVFRFIEDQALVAQVLPVGVMPDRPAARGTETAMETLDPFSFGATVFVSHRHPAMAPAVLQQLLIDGYERIFALSRTARLRTLREMAYHLAYCLAYRKWRPRLEAHVETLSREPTPAA